MARNNEAKVQPIPEDSVECLFFSSSNEILNLFWESLCQQLNTTIQTLSKNYIWQRDEFKIHLPVLHDKKKVHVLAILYNHFLTF